MPALPSTTSTRPRSKKRPTSRSGGALVGILMVLVVLGAGWWVVSDLTAGTRGRPGAAPSSSAGSWSVDGVWEEVRAGLAESRFVPQVRSAFPGLTQGVPDDRLTRVALHACAVFDTNVGSSTLRVDTAAPLTHGTWTPTRGQVNRVIRMVVLTTCAEHGYLLTQYE